MSKTDWYVRRTMDGTGERKRMRSHENAGGWRKEMRVPRGTARGKRIHERIVARGEREEQARIQRAAQRQKELQVLAGHAA